MPDRELNCPHCSQRLEVFDDAAGKLVHCPVCNQDFTAPAIAQTPEAASGAQKCGICLSPLLRTEARQVCPACAAEYHADCWQENGGCAVYGCSQVPAAEKRQAIDIPMSFWGQEHKQCPNCKREILAAAVRCRHCGATFESASPQNESEFQQRGELKQRLPAIRRTVVWLFVFSVLPCVAPIGAVWGAVWYPTHREEVRALPSLYGALCKIGLGVAIGQTVLVVMMTLLYTILRR